LRPVRLHLGAIPDDGDPYRSHDQKRCHDDCALRFHANLIVGRGEFTIRVLSALEMRGGRRILYMYV